MKPLLIGGRYDIGSAIGSGGFGTVFRATDRRSGADVALKLVPPGLGSDEAAARLRREGEIVRRVSSRRVARVYDSGEGEEGTWLVSELVDGAPLTAATLGRALLPHEVLRVARGLLEGLAAVHEAGIVHGDVKPTNVLVAREVDVLESVKIVDFGLARIVSRSELGAAVGVESEGDGTVLGTARWMAPEVLAGGEPTVRSDIYSAGLVLFELLDIGALFPVGSGTAQQLRARLLNDPDLATRVPAPLSDVLACMLARAPTQRWRDAREAHDAVADLDTAPVALSRAAGSGRPRATAERSRLTRLPFDSVGALRETLRHLDLPMLDALARRERGNAVGRIARALALSLRLELDAAALVLEPLAAQSEVARAIGVAVVAPRARRATRARVDGDRDDRWIEAIDVELAAMLVALGAALSTSDDAERVVARCTRALARIESPAADESTPSGRESTRTTLYIAHVAARARHGELEREAARALLAPLVVRVDRSEPPFHVVVRALCRAALVDDGAPPGQDLLAELDLAEESAGDTGITLLDACVSATLGGLLAVQSPSDVRALTLLERASTLLSNGDVPSLEHDAEHHRGATLVARGEWGAARASLRVARAAAHAERALAAEVRSAGLEVLAALASGDLASAYESATVLGEPRLVASSARDGAIGWVARALVALSASDRDGAEDALAEAEARVREPDRTTADVYVLVEVIGILFDAARGALPDVTPVSGGRGSAEGGTRDIAAPAVALARFADGRGLESFHWLILLDAIVERIPDADASKSMRTVLARIDSVLGPRRRFARDRPTDAPPNAS